MNAYLPNDFGQAMIALSALMIVLVLGFPIIQIRSLGLSRLVSWLIVIFGVAGIEIYTVSQPAGFRMLIIIGMLLFSMKIVVASEAVHSGKTNLRWTQWISFAALWVGMRPALFNVVPQEPRPKVQHYAKLGLKNIAFGVVLIVAARMSWITTEDWRLAVRLVLTTILLLPGISLVLHFGLFHLLTAFWRSMGAECQSVFRDPLKATSLNEFWGRRWNLAFSEMTTLAVFRPLKNRFGKRFGILASFVFSGVLHELAISLPVRSGFGGPLLYFMIHGVGMLLESNWVGLATRIKSSPALGRLWTLAWLILPLPLLFHYPFLEGCVWPLIGIQI